MRFGAGVYCGVRWWRIRDWRTYGLFRRGSGFFSLGPIMFLRKEQR